MGAQWRWARRGPWGVGEAGGPAPRPSPASGTRWHLRVPAVPL